MRGLLSSIRFFTVLPVGGDSRFDPKGAAVYVPVTGVLVGLLLASLDAAASRLWPVQVVSLVDVAFLAWITGALHIDGLADTADGLYGNRGREESLRIMKDSRVGSMGVVAVVGCLAAKWAGLQAIEQHRLFLLVLVPAYGRCAVLFGMRFLDYARGAEGTASGFFDRPLSPYDFRWAAAVALSSILAGGAVFVLLNLSFALVCFSMILFYRKRIGSVTGDMLGAMIETTEAVLFVVLSARTF